MIGFSCTGKTSLGTQVFGEDILDSDKELRQWIGNKEGQPFAHVYEIFMKLGRKRALAVIQGAENALIDRWAGDTRRLIISLGPGFPFRDNWVRLRAISKVVLFRKSPQGIYSGMKERREKIFADCPEAKSHDNWDVGVIVDDNRTELSQEVAIMNIQRLLDERENYYRDNDGVVETDNRNAALRELKKLKTAFENPNSVERRRVGHSNGEL